MAGFVVTTASSIICPHGAATTIASSNTRVTAAGAPIATVSDTYTVSGCPFQVPVGPGTKPQPCVTLRWIAPATRVRVGSRSCSRPVRRSA
jgi:hypothetical protein